MSTHDEQNLPSTPPATTPATAPEATSADAARPRRRVPRAALIGAGAAVALLLVGGGGVALGAALEHDDDDDRADTPASSVQRDGDDAPGAAAPAPSGPVATIADPDDLAAAMTAAIDAAVAAADGTGASDIDAGPGGWDVEVLLADGATVDVQVDASGAARVSTDRDSGSSDPALETSRLAEILAAATDAAGGGTVESVATDDTGARYEVSVRTANGEDVDVDLAEDLAVLDVDRD